MKNFIKRAEVATKWNNFTVSAGGWYGRDDHGLFAASGWTCNGCAYIYRCIGGKWEADWESGDFTDYPDDALAVAPLICYEAEIKEEDGYIVRF